MVEWNANLTELVQLAGHRDSCAVADASSCVQVNGENAHPLYQVMRAQQPQSVPATLRTMAGSSSIEWYAPCQYVLPVCVLLHANAETVPPSI